MPVKYPSTMRVNGIGYAPDGTSVFYWYIDTATGGNPIATRPFSDFNEDFNNDYGPPGVTQFFVNPE